MKYTQLIFRCNTVPYQHLWNESLVRNLWERKLPHHLRAEHLHHISLNMVFISQVYRIGVQNLCVVPVSNYHTIMVCHVSAHPTKRLVATYRLIHPCHLF